MVLNASFLSSFCCL